MKQYFSGTYSLGISETRKISHPSWTRKISESLGTSCLYSSSKPEGWLILKTGLDLLFFFWGSIQWNVEELGLSSWKFRCSTRILAPKPCVSGVPLRHSRQFKPSAQSTAAGTDPEIVILKSQPDIYGQMLHDSTYVESKQMVVVVF